MTENKKLTCSFCNYSSTNLIKVGEKTLCVICKYTLKPSPSDTHKIVAAYSINPQYMINKLCREFIVKNDYIPTPHNIDPNCRLIKINPTVLHDIIEIMSSDDKSCFLNIKFFLTTELDIKEIKCINYFQKHSDKKHSDKKHSLNSLNNLNNLNVPEYIDLLKHQKNIFDKYYQKFVDNNSIKLKKLFKN